MLSRLDELDQYISKNLEKLDFDDVMLHQLAAPHSGLVTLSYQIASSNKSTYKKVNVYFLHEVKPKGEGEGECYGIMVKIKEIGNPIWYEFIGNQKQLFDLYNQTDLQIETAFLSPNIAPLPGDYSWSNLSEYDDETHSNYAIIHKNIAKQAALFTSDIKPKEILLLDLGTGLGDSLDAVAQELLKQNPEVKIQAVGVDLDETNIESAKKSYPNYEFIRADIKDLQKIFTALNPQKNKTVIITSSGSLTRKVLKNTVEALYVFQQAYRLAHALIADGVNPVLSIKKQARKIGWDANSVKSNGPWVGTFVLKKSQSPYIPKIKNGTLNLSLHANPLEVIELLTDTKEITCLDLGLAYLTSGEMKIILSKLPQLTQLFLSGEELNIQELLAVLKKANIQVSIDRATYINDIFEVVTDGWKENKSEPINQELKRFSIKAVGKFLLLPNIKSIHSLVTTIKTQREIYGELSWGSISLPGKNLDTEKTVEGFINDLKSRSEKGDDAATYRLAMIMENGVNVKKQINEKYFSFENCYQNLSASLKYWRILFNKKYPVYDHLVRIDRLIEENKNNFDLLKEKAENNNSASNSDEDQSDLTSLQNLAADLSNDWDDESFSNNASDDENDNNKGYTSYFPSSPNRP